MVQEMQKDSAQNVERVFLTFQETKRLRLEFHGARITSDAGLLACRELDGALGLTERWHRSIFKRPVVAGMCSISWCP